MAKRSDSNWLLLRALFAELVDLQGPARDQRLREVAEEHSELHAELIKLLANQDTDVDAVESAVAAIASDLQVSGGTEAPSPDLSRWEGAEFGSYRVIAPIASGGMGDVLRAERTDGEYDQQVALKVLRHDVLSLDGGRRFREERQILARLNHPGIARILDGGTTAEGMSFLVMELIDGVPIHRYCIDQQLPLSKILQLFQQVCVAVEYAHKNLVVHRDIKPENILVDGSGTPKLLDFGIAKLLEPSVAADTPTGAATKDEASNVAPTVTVAPARRMTPDYASPEQLLGLPVSTASDVYSLGVLLYELLTQKRPRSLRGLKPIEVEKMLFTTSPTRPSEHRSTATAQHARLLQGDIDNIVLKALAAEPSQRYGSAQQLSADIQRWFHNQPVAARSPSLSYVTGRFIRRNRWWVIGTTMVLGLVVGAVAYHIQQITNERLQVEAQARQKSQVADFLESVLRSTTPDNVAAAEVSARTLLDSARTRLSNQLVDQPAVRASLLGTLGSAYTTLGLDVESITTLEEAVELARSAGDPEILATQLTYLAVALDRTSDLERGQSLLNEALELTQTHAPGTLTEIEALTALAHTRHLAGDYPESIASAERSLDLLRQLNKKDSVNYSTALMVLGQSQMFAGQAKNAVTTLEEAVAVQRIVAPHNLAERLKYEHNLATALIEVGEDDRAEPLLRAVLNGERERLGSDHPNLDSAMVVLGLLYQRNSRLDESEELLREALAHSLKVRGELHRYTGYNRVVLAKLLDARKEFTAAEHQFTRALTIYKELLEPEHPYQASARSGYAAMLLAADRPEEAKQQALAALKISEAALPAGHRLTVSTRGLLGLALARLGEVDRARSQLDAALSQLKSIPGQQVMIERLEEALAEL